MKLCMIGTGYVGLVSGVCFSDLGNTVYCVDKDVNKINALNSGKVPIYEPGLEEILKRLSRVVTHYVIMPESWTQKSVLLRDWIIWCVRIFLALSTNRVFLFKFR